MTEDGQQVGRNKSAQFRHCQLPENIENSCRNCADLFRPTFCLASEQGSKLLETALVGAGTRFLGGAAMSAKSWNYYLVKTARVSGWLLFLLVLLYIVTGFALCGEYGFDWIIGEQAALSIHKIFEWPLVATFVTHSVVTSYFAFRRWGWIKTRAAPSRSTAQTPAPADGPKPQEPRAAKS